MPIHNFRIITKIVKNLYNITENLSLEIYKVGSDALRRRQIYVNRGLQSNLSENENSVKTSYIVVLSFICGAQRGKLSQ